MGLALGFAGNGVVVRTGGREIDSALRFLFRRHVVRTAPDASRSIDIRWLDGAYRVTRGDASVLFASEGLLYPALYQVVLDELACSARRHAMLHATGLECNRRAVLLLAPPGSGKTLLACWLVGQGHRLLSDDLMAVAADHAVRGLASPFYVKNQGLAVLEGFPWLTRCREHWRRGEGVTFVPGGARSPGPVSLGRLIFIRFIGGADLRARGLRVGECAGRLMGSLMNGEHLPRRGLAAIMALARSIPGHAVEYGCPGEFSVWLRNSA